MQRRTALKWIVRTLASFCAAIVALPGVCFVAAALRKNKGRGATIQRVAKLGDLPVGQPVEFPIIAERRDAWALYPQEAIGRVWVVRRSDDSVEAAASQVDAYTSVCPHLGCAISHDSSAEQFTCPCHQAAWNVTGERVADAELGHKNVSPRSMDMLQSKLVLDSQTDEWWVEVSYEKFEYGLTQKKTKA